MNTISPIAPGFNRDNMRTVKVTTMRGMPSSAQFYVMVHDEIGTVRKVLSHEFNNSKLIKEWTEKDHVIVNVEGRGYIKFVTHGMKGPQYPVAELVNRNGKTRRVRVTFLSPIQMATTKTEAAMAARPADIVPASQSLVIEGECREIIPEVLSLPSPEEKNVSEDDFPKPVMSDYENRGAFLKACRERKVAMREAGLVLA